MLPVVIFSWVPFILITPLQLNMNSVLSAPAVKCTLTIVQLVLLVLDAAVLNVMQLQLMTWMTGQFDVIVLVVMNDHS